MVTLDSRQCTEKKAQRQKHEQACTIKEIIAKLLLKKPLKIRRRKREIKSIEIFYNSTSHLHNFCFRHLQICLQARSTRPPWRPWLKSKLQRAFPTQAGKRHFHWFQQERTQLMPPGFAPLSNHACHDLLAMPRQRSSGKDRGEAGSWDKNTSLRGRGGRRMAGDPNNTGGCSRPGSPSTEVPGVWFGDVLFSFQDNILL